MPTPSSNCPLCGYHLDVFDSTCPRCKGQGLPQNTPPVQSPEPQHVAAPPAPPKFAAMPGFNPAPARQGPPRWVIPLVGAGSALMLALVMGYWYWISTPQYSLLQARNAFNAHDLGTFEKYVAIDVCADAFTDDLFAEALAKLQAQSGTNDNAFASAGREMAKGFVALLKPTVSGALKTKTRELVSKGEITPFDPSSAQGPVDLEQLKNNVESNGLQFKGVGDVDIDGNTALVELRFHNEKQNTDQPVQLEMRRVERHWQVSRWKNVAEWIKKASDSINK